MQWYSILLQFRRSWVRIPSRTLYFLFWSFYVFILWEVSLPTTSSVVNWSLRTSNERNSIISELKFTNVQWAITWGRKGLNNNTWTPELLSNKKPRFFLFLSTFLKENNLKKNQWMSHFHGFHLGYFVFIFPIKRPT